MALTLTERTKLALLQDGLDHIDQGISVFDDQLRLVFWNRRYFDILEFPLDLAEVGRPFADFVAYNVERGEYGTGDPQAQAAERLSRARLFSAYYLERTRPNGVMLAIHGVPLSDGGFISVYTDITEQKQAERLIQERNEELERRVLARTRDLETTNRELKLSEARLQTITDAVPAGIAYVDAEDRYQFANARIARAFGYEKEKILGKTTDEVLGPEVAALLRPHLERGRAGEEATFEYEAAHAGGRRTDIRTTVLPDLDEARRFKGYYALSLDVSDQKKAEAAMAQAQKLEAVAGLSGGLAHDFNNLLTVMLGNLVPLKDSGRLAPEDLELLDPAIEAARRGVGLIRRLLAFSRRDPLAPVSVDLASLIEGFVALLGRSLPPGLKVTKTLPEGPLLAFVDPLGLENALLNLCFNARDAMSDGGSLALSVERVDLGSGDGVSPGAYFRVTVADTGSGIESAVLDRVFEPFFTTKGQGSGTGLGLSMVYGFAKQSGGTVRIRSETGQGTEVSLFIPAGDPAGQPDASLEAIDVETAGGGKLVLLVDDEQEVRRVVRRQLTELGYPTLEASDGDSALELLEHVEEIEILLSDVVMPGSMSGYDLIREAQSRRPSLRGLLMSAHRNPAYGEGGANVDVPLLRKPFETHELDQGLRLVISRKEA